MYLTVNHLCIISNQCLGMQNIQTLRKQFQLYSYWKTRWHRVRNPLTYAMLGIAMNSQMYKCLPWANRPEFRDGKAFILPSLQVGNNSHPTISGVCWRGNNSHRSGIKALIARPSDKTNIGNITTSKDYRSDDLSINSDTALHLSLTGNSDPALTIWFLMHWDSCQQLHQHYHWKRNTCDDRSNMLKQNNTMKLLKLTNIWSFFGFFLSVI